MNSFFSLTDKKIIIVVPHPDDEINVLGSLYEHFGKNNHLNVLFVTSGDKNILRLIREREAINASKTISDDIKLHFLRYPDYSIIDNRHLYNFFHNYESDSLFDSTIDDIDNQDNALRRNLVKDIYDYLVAISPDIVFFNGYDNHPDHKMVFLSVLKAIDKLLCTGRIYPDIYFGYAYETSYNAPDDYLQLNFESTVCTNELSKNHFYLWEERNRFPVMPGYLKYNYKKSKLIPILKKYKSQKMVSRFFRIQNSDHVFWRIPSILLQSNIKERSILSNYLLFDSDNVLLSGNERFINPRERNSTFSFRFAKKVYIKTVILCGDNLLLCKKDVVFLFPLDESVKGDNILFLWGNEFACCFAINSEVEAVDIVVKSKKASISRVFFDDVPQLKVCKICYQNNFIYDFICKPTKHYSFSIYSNIDSDPSHYFYYLNGKELPSFDCVCFDKKGTFSLKIIYKEDFNLFDEVNIVVKNTIIINFFISFKRMLHKINLTVVQAKTKFTHICVSLKHLLFGSKAHKTVANNKKGNVV